MTPEEKAQAYDKALRIAKKNYDTAQSLCDGSHIGVECFKNTLTNIFPELKEPEGEDEKIRKAIIDSLPKYGYLPQTNIKVEEARAWLEKQESVGEIVARCKTSWYNEGKIQGQTEGLSDEEKYQQGWRDALEKQGRDKDKIPATDKLYEHIRNTCACIEEAMTCNNTKDAKDYIMQAKYDAQSALDMLEKPVEKVESKFHKGEWIVKEDGNECFADGSYAVRIEEVNDDNYSLSNGNVLSGPFTVYSYRLWDISDAKDGDILAFYSEYKGNKMMQVGIVKEYVGKHGGCSNTFSIYAGVNWENNLQIGEYMGCSDIQPATKEQRDALMVAMADAGYVFDFEKKELKKIEKSEDKLFQYITEERNKSYFYYNGKEASWNDMPYDVRKHDYPYHFVGELDCFPFSRAQNKLTGSQKSIWSEEDEINYNYALAACIYYGASKGYNVTKTHQEALAWLKSLKQRL